MTNQNEDREPRQREQPGVPRLLAYAALLLALLWAVPLLAIGVATFINSTLRDGSSAFVLPLMTTIAAMPVFAAVWLLIRSRER